MTMESSERERADARVANAKLGVRHHCQLMLNALEVDPVEHTRQTSLRWLGIALDELESARTEQDRLYASATKEEPAT